MTASRRFVHVGLDHVQDEPVDTRRRMIDASLERRHTDRRRDHGYGPRRSAHDLWPRGEAWHARSSDRVLTEIRDRALIITLNRPEVRNAVDGAIATGVEAAMDQLEADDDLLIGIITGSGSAFCAGADLKVLAQLDSDVMPALTKRGHFAGFVNREAQTVMRPSMGAVAVASRSGSP